jgi:hypothetical protein
VAPAKTFEQTMLRPVIVMLSIGNPPAAGTQRRQALQQCPVILADMTACVITRKLWRVEAMLDTAAFLTWRDCPRLVRRWFAAPPAIVKVFAGPLGVGPTYQFARPHHECALDHSPRGFVFALRAAGQFLQKAPPRKNSAIFQPADLENPSRKW